MCRQQAHAWDSYVCETVPVECRQERAVEKPASACFEQVAVLREQDDALDLAENPNDEKYPGQSEAVVEMARYAFLAPYKEVGKEIELKTFIPEARSNRQALWEAATKKHILELDENRLLDSWERGEWTPSKHRRAEAARPQRYARTNTAENQAHQHPGARTKPFGRSNPSDGGACPIRRKYLTGPRSEKKCARPMRGLRRDKRLCRILYGPDSVDSSTSSWTMASASRTSISPRPSQRRQYRAPPRSGSHKRPMPPHAGHRTSCRPGNRRT